MDPLIEDLVLEARNYAEKGDWTKAEELTNKIFQIKPASQKALQIYAFVLFNKNKFIEAINAIQEVIQNTKFAQVNYELLGSCYMRLKQFENAKEIYLKILEIDPQNVNAHLELSYIYLIKEKWDEGWSHYEFRYSKANQQYLKNFDKAKDWNGIDSIKNKKIVIYSEQGYGDFILFSRYIDKFKELGVDVYVDTPQDLQPLFPNLNRPFNFEYDYHCSIASLPYFLNIEDYKGTTPYINANKFDLLEYRNNFKIGFAWTGSPLNPTQDHRSCDLKDFLKLTNIENVRLFSLQKDITLESSHHVIDMSSHMTDFRKTAEIIQAMDLIITVDTCILHLAGAMNKDCWGLLSYYACWRWGEKETPIWYDSVKLLRQEKPKDWETVFNKVKKELEKNARKKILDS